MERRLFRSTSTEHLVTELRQYGLSQHEPRRDAARSGPRTQRLMRDTAGPDPRRALGRSLRMLVRAMAG